MPQVKLTINQRVVMDIDISRWNSEPPAITELKLKTAEQPWAIPTMQAIAAAAIKQQSTDITVTTTDTMWTLQVEQQ